jgi:hypothetical protein
MTSYELEKKIESVTARYQPEIDKLEKDGKGVLCIDRTIFA